MNGKCETCLNSRSIISENGFHPICCLHWRLAKECVLGERDHYIKNPAIKDKDGGGE